MRRELWLWPVVLAGSTMVGLIATLLGEGGAWWAVSWIGVAAPLLVTAWKIMRSYSRD
jgi:hypothetical protein